MTTETLTVSLGDRSYDIHFGKGLGKVFGEWISVHGAGADVFVVTDRNVAGIYGEDIVRWLGNAPHAVLAIEPGEGSKTWETVRAIYAFLAKGSSGRSGFGADRDSIVVAFGGGVVGDLAGFAAATYSRGIRYVQVPTTLLAQVDSSVGGKTGFNLPEGKNLVGAFHQPRAVFIDRSFLLTLDDRNLRAGMAEVVKCALAGDASLWTLLLDHGARWKAMTDRDWGTVVRRSVAFKASVVEKDEKEASTRRILNLGHTIGHALERAAGYGRYLHGEAVAMGLAWEAVFSARLGVTPPELADRICGLLGEMGFVLDDAGVPTPAIAAALSADKKRVETEIELPMVAAPGACSLRRVPAARLGADLAGIRDEVRERARMRGLIPAAGLPERAEAGGRGTAVPADARAQRVAREIERDIRNAPREAHDGPAAPPRAGAPQAPPGSPRGVAGPPAEGSARASSLVRTITMANVCWAQGRRDEAREIIAEILRNEPGDARALAWRAEHDGKTGDRGADAAARKLTSLLETIAKEYGYDISGPV